MSSMYSETKIKKWLYCVVIVYCASNAYKNDMESDLIVSNVILFGVLG